MTDIFISGVKIDRSKIQKGSYVSKIPSLKKVKELSFDTNITFFVGENGSGKSTLLEAIATEYGFNGEGGSLNYKFSTYDDISPLNEAITLIKGVRRAKYGFFFRAETFFNVSTAAVNKYESSENFHTLSHGEGIFSLFENFGNNGLYIMDEPEAALSPSKQKEVKEIIEKLAENGSQFIIATHSPILTACNNSTIYSFDGEKVGKCEYEETGIYQVYKDYFI